MPRMLELDWEGRSRVDLKKFGLDIYASDPSTEVLMAAYAIDGSDFRHWEAHKEPIPEELVDALMDPDCEKWAFNAAFERVITRKVLKLATPYKGWRCTQALAAMQSFDGGLDEVGKRVNLPEDLVKDKGGLKLIQMFSMPQKITKSNSLEWFDWTTHPEEWENFCRYNIQDCVAERAIRRRLIKYHVPRFEWELYELDQIINDRGKPVNRTFAERAIAMAEKRKAELTEEMRGITDLMNPGSVSQLIPWLMDRGYRFDDLGKDTVKKELSAHTAAVLEGKEGHLSDDCVKVLKLRQWQARLSVTKYNAIVKYENGGRIRQLFQFAGAARTNRWAGRLVQTQNLSATPPDLEDLSKLQMVNRWIADNEYENLSMFMGEPMEALVGCVRSSFQTEKGKQFVVADLSSIESAVIAWLTGCTRLLNVFRDGRDPYKDFATDFYRIKYEEVTKAQRKICKPPTLGCGYRLGAGGMFEGKRTGLWGYAENMGVDIPQAEAARAVKVFRSIYPEIPEMWKALERGVTVALTERRAYSVGLVTFRYESPYLTMELPSGRKIYYFQPRLEPKTVRTGRFKTVMVEGEEYEEEETFESIAFTYMGRHQKTRQWVRIDSHGGKIIEQATQGTARDVLAVKLMALHKDGFNLVAHVHDEALSEEPINSNYYRLQRMVDHMKSPIKWAPGLPLGAAGWEGQFYRKD